MGELTADVTNPVSIIVEYLGGTRPFCVLS